MLFIEDINESIGMNQLALLILHGTCVVYFLEVVSLSAIAL